MNTAEVSLALNKSWDIWAVMLTSVQDILLGKKKKRQGGLNCSQRNQATWALTWEWRRGVTFKGARDRWAVAASARGRFGGRGAWPLTFAQPKTPPPDRLLSDVRDPYVLTKLSVFAPEEIRQVVHLQSKFSQWGVGVAFNVCIKP